mmetsp:Transcript_2075/g.5967  ORF Transcript_2075/g.5967 Transcript_2075/m.5967 type:complete len:364 (-) Transcript_2075:87-1178(-)
MAAGWTGKLRPSTSSAWPADAHPALWSPRPPRRAWTRCSSRARAPAASRPRLCRTAQASCDRTRLHPQLPPATARSTAQPPSSPTPSPWTPASSSRALPQLHRTATVKRRRLWSAPTWRGRPPPTRGARGACLRGQAAKSPSPNRWPCSLPSVPDHLRLGAAGRPGGAAASARRQRWRMPGKRSRSPTASRPLAMPRPASCTPRWKSCAGGPGTSWHLAGPCRHQGTSPRMRAGGWSSSRASTAWGTRGRQRTRSSWRRPWGQRSATGAPRALPLMGFGTRSVIHEHGRYPSCAATTRRQMAWSIQPRIPGILAPTRARGPGRAQASPGPGRSLPRSLGSTPLPGLHGASLAEEARGTAGRRG